VTSAEHIQEQPPLIVIQRWKRYGHDRAYVQVDGVQVGYRDLISSRVHCGRPEHHDLIDRATARLARFNRPERVQASVAQASVTPTVTRPQPAAEAPPVLPRGRPDPAVAADRDLALNHPGAAAREQAIALREAAPLRTFLARVFGVKTDERAWRIGADAERAVAQRLLQLGPEWRFLHAVPVGENGSDIDHVVIGPSGVFTVNTKNHPHASIWVRGDTFKVNGQNQHYVRNSRFEAGRAAKLLSAAALFEVEVRGVIAVMGARDGFTVKEQPRDGAITVVTREAVGSHLSSLPTVLGAPSIERIFQCARHLATWQPKTVRWTEFGGRTGTQPAEGGRDVPR